MSQLPEWSKGVLLGAALGGAGWVVHTLIDMGRDIRSLQTQLLQMEKTLDVHGQILFKLALDGSANVQ